MQPSPVLWSLQLCRLWVCVCILATGQTLMLIKREYMSPRWKKKIDGNKPVYRCTVFSLSISSLLFFYFLVCRVLLSSLSPPFGLLRLAHTLRKACKQPCYCGTCVHNVLAALQFQEWHYTFQEMDPNWIKLCYNTDCMLDDVDWFWRRSKQDGGTVLRERGGWLIRFCTISKHLDLLWGAGYPKIPPKSILFLLHPVSVCFTSGLLECKGSKTYIQKCQHQRLVPENYNERPVHESYLLATAHMPNRCHQQKAARQMAVSRLSCRVDLRCWWSVNWFFRI